MRHPWWESSLAWSRLIIGVPGVPQPQGEIADD